MSTTHPDFVTVHHGSAPLVLSLPHTGTQLPEALLPSLVSPALALKDTDWRIDLLYAFARELGASLVHTAVSRTAIDVNRDPSGVSLYPGQATTGLVPLETFDGEPLYRPGAEPDAAGLAERRKAWFEPYHAALAAEIARVRAEHPRIVVYDCHSIRSLVPRLFEGELPVFNIGSNGGTSCDEGLTATVRQACERSGESLVVDGRFRGGWITRHYGERAKGVHAIQMELAQRFYMDEDRPEVANAAKAGRAAAILRTVLENALAWVRG
ncbi:N-formylglutamate deformylase [Labrys wisconsinensis]|uniref:Formiminoglutamase n=1 Tax=Labrys wisconsinensis TaxID=425677 RepID=A0ABU0J2A6_9HYPH|nr:N-formylglutamate deformylase [Labrys wisconsinensis]MDQ0467578.1 formiminoglutamase [Labrys wisconsinensis]